MKKFIQNIKGFFAKPDVGRSLLDIPNAEIIECEIETPQHKDGKVYKMQKQTGKFYKSDMKFLHDGILMGHDVQFHNMKDFQKALLRVF